MDFSMGAYEHLLAGLLEKGYQVCTFFEEPPTDGGLLLRHDIDIDIFGCRSLARIEESLGLRSTWFFQPNNDYYNPLSAQCLEILCELSARNDIGLHIDPAMFSTPEQMTQSVERMFSFYSQYIPLKRIFSFHRPAKRLRDMTLPIAGFINAYDRRFTERMAYVSDSNRRPFVDQERYIDAVSKGRSLFILTHPLWWKDRSLEKEEILTYLLSQTERAICRRALAGNITMYADMNVCKDEER